jgi:putative DNA primase/helicase
MGYIDTSSSIMGEGDQSPSADQLTPLSSAKNVHMVLAAGPPEGMSLPDLVAKIASRTCLSATRLRWSRQRMEVLANVPAPSGGALLAINTLMQGYNGGLHLQVAADGAILRYSGTHWSRLPESRLRQQLMSEAMARPAAYGGKPAALVGEAVQVIKALQANPEDIEPLAPVINVLNGELWLANDGSFELRPHRAETGMRHVLPVTFDPQAKAPLFEKILGDVFAKAEDGPDTIRHVLEIMAYASQPVRDLPAIVVFLGGGANGKSTILDVLRGMVGDDQVYASSVRNLSRDRFSLPDLAGKLMFVDDDATDGAKLDDGLLKVMAGDSVITARRLGSGSGVKFRSTALPVIAMNGSPDLPDSSYGFLRRLLVVPFNRRFEPHEIVPKIAETVLVEERAGVLNLLLEGFARLRARGRFAQPEECAHARDGFLTASNPLHAFLDEMCERDPAAQVGLTPLYEAFRCWMAGQDRKMPFIRARLKARLQAMGMHVHKSNVMVVDGLRLRE